MFEYIWQAFLGLGGLATFTGIVAWAVKQLVTRQLSMELEKFKHELKEKTDRELELLRTEEKKRALEHEVRFRKLHEKAAETVHEIYKLLSCLYSRIASYLSPVDFGQTKDEKVQLVGKANDAFQQFYLENRIFLPPDVVAEVDEFCSKSTAISRAFSFGLHEEKIGITRQDQPDHWEIARKAFNNELVPIYNKIYGQLQAILGLNVQGDAY